MRTLRAKDGFTGWCGRCIASVKASRNRCSRCGGKLLGFGAPK